MSGCRIDGKERKQRTQEEIKVLEEEKNSEQQRYAKGLPPGSSESFGTANPSGDVKDHRPDEGKNTEETNIPRNIEEKTRGDQDHFPPCLTEGQPKQESYHQEGQEENMGKIQLSTILKMHPGECCGTGLPVESKHSTASEGRQRDTQVKRWWVAGLGIFQIAVMHFWGRVYAQAFHKLIQTSPEAVLDRYQRCPGFLRACGADPIHG